MNELISNWESIDALKILLSIIAGFTLGVEREFKDKSAGLKTITIICLGSTLFTILSFKLGAGESEDATRIASYVVSGIGFLGAGVIFKDGFNVGGLTTASIIWMAAAVGMALGFGEFFLAFGFLVASVLVVSVGNLVNRWIFDKRVVKIITVYLNKDDIDYYNSLTQELKLYSKRVKEKAFSSNEENIIVTYDIFIEKEKLNKLKAFLLNSSKIIRFEM